LNVYNDQAALVKHLLLEHERSRELEVITGLLGSYYRFLNNKLTCKSAVGPQGLDSGELATDETTKATALNDYVCSVFTHDDDDAVLHTQ